MTELRKFVCPETKAPLEQKGNSLTAKGNIKYEVRGGIPHFLRYEPIESEETRQNLEKLNDLTKKKGWQKAMVEVYGEDSDIYVYSTDTDRFKFLDLLPLTPKSEVLEIGTGLGQFTAEIARRSKVLDALEIVSGQAAFVQLRCKEEGLDNVQLACGGDDCRLPYPDQHYDVVICSLVLEWCSHRNAEEPFVAGQQRLLDEINRVLKPGGITYVSTKNRYSLHYLIGKQDEHSYRMRFGNALPRWLHHLALRLKGKDRPVGLLHSYNQLKGMFAQAGFGEIKSYWAIPEMRFPKRFVLTDSAPVAEARRELNNEALTSMRSTNLLLRFIPDSLVKHVTQGLVFVATKPN